MSELCACPFCGFGDYGVTEFSAKGKGVMRAIQCGQCLATGPFCKSLDQAIVGWQMRDGEQQPISSGE